MFEPKLGFEPKSFQFVAEIFIHLRYLGIVHKQRFEL